MILSLWPDGLASLWALHLPLLHFLFPPPRWAAGIKDFRVCDTAVRRSMLLVSPRETESPLQLLHLQDINGRCFWSLYAHVLSMY